MKLKTINNSKGEGYVDSGVKILIAVVIGALILGGIYTVQKNVIMKNANDKIQELFNYGNDAQNETPSYEIRYQTADRVSDNGEMVVMSRMMYSDYDHLTVDGNYVTEKNGEIIVTDSDPGTAYLIALGPFFRTLEKGNHTIRMYDKDGGFCEVFFEKV